MTRFPGASCCGSCTRRCGLGSYRLSWCMTRATSQLALAFAPSLLGLFRRANSPRRGRGGDLVWFQAHDSCTLPALPRWRWHCNLAQLEAPKRGEIRRAFTASLHRNSKFYRVSRPSVFPLTELLGLAAQWGSAGDRRCQIGWGSPIARFCLGGERFWG